MQGAAVTAPASLNLGTCVNGHEHTTGNTGWVSGHPYCLECVATVHRIAEDQADLTPELARLIGVALGTASMPSREEVYAS